MQFEEVIRNRRTVREYEERPVSDLVIEEILSLAQQAPSSMNGQPWHFIVVRNRVTLDRLVELKNHYCPPEKQEFGADFIRKAPAVIFVCVNRDKSYDRGIETAVLATAYILLGACSRGLSGVYMSAYRADKPEIAQSFRELLDIPADFDPVTIIPLGYPAVEPPAKVVPSISGVISYEAFSNK
ncbi:MAG: nitroreductase family protein [Acidobacteriota bacterium]